MTGPVPLTTGPCEPWTTAEEAADCCSAVPSSDPTLLDQAIEQASELLFVLSGARFTGLCERTVRPCASRCSCWGASPFPSFRWEGSFWSDGCGSRCGCRPLSRVKLAGYPVREILEVEIDGELVDAADYRLDRHRYLVRLSDENGRSQRWPSCQRMDIDEGEGTFFITYLHGVDVPVSGRLAAGQLACQMMLGCSSDSEEECELPTGTTRVTRQGLTVEAETLGAFLAKAQTGLAHVDSFLSVHGRQASRPAAVWTPELDPFPVTVNVGGS